MTNAELAEARILDAAGRGFTRYSLIVQNVAIRMLTTWLDAATIEGVNAIWLLNNTAITRTALAAAQRANVRSYDAPSMVTRDELLDRRPAARRPSEWFDR